MAKPHREDREVLHGTTTHHIQHIQKGKLLKSDNPLHSPRAQ